MTIGLVFAAIYCQQFRLELRLSSKKMRGFRQPYPIKLFYGGNIALIVYTVILHNIYVWSQITARFFPNNFVFGILGKWDSELKAPRGGLAYYLSPQFGLLNMLRDPIHTVMFATFFGLLCINVSRLWIDISGNNAKDVARQFSE